MITPGSYRADPWGWIGNQCGHTLLGFAAAFSVSCLWFLVHGEMPYSEDGWLVVAAGYLAFEIITQGWKGADTVEDWVFVAVYGSGATFYSAQESAPGTMLVIVDVAGLFPIVAFAGLHFAIGFLFRVIQERQMK